jgi:hypothetical protein
LAEAAGGNGLNSLNCSKRNSVFQYLASRRRLQSHEVDPRSNNLK